MSDIWFALHCLYHRTDHGTDGMHLAIADLPEGIRLGGRLPVARLVPLDAEPSRPRILVGFLSGRVSVPDDFDRMGEDELVAQFEGAGPAASR
ncbi:MAG: hypothetical protein ABL886_12790 [Rhodoglobus sp.]